MVGLEYTVGWQLVEDGNVVGEAGLLKFLDCFPHVNLY